MSWLVNSIANSLKLDDDDDDENQHIRAGGGSATSGVSEEPSRPHSKSDDGGHKSFSSDFQNSSRSGVREDLSELSKTLTRQLWGVASFLAPPPEMTNSYRQQQSGSSDPDTSSSTRIEGIRSDLYEISGRFRSGISKISANKTVSDFTKVASDFLQFGSEEENEYAQRGVVGVTEEVVAFARDISMHPETWLDFPLSDDNEGEQDFDLSDTQQEHALAVEKLAPGLAALRIELCPGYMSEGCFWMIYFVLVHPRLTRQDALILSSPQIKRTRAMLTSELWSRLKPEAEDSSKSGIDLAGNISDKKEPPSVLSSDPSQPVTINVLGVEPSMSMEADFAEVDKHPLASVEIPVIDKAIVEEISAHHAKNEKSIIPECVEDEGDEADDWLKESVEIGVNDGYGNAALQDDDISFSDLEDDDDDGEIPIKQ